MPSQEATIASGSKRGALGRWRPRLALALTLGVVPLAFAREPMTHAARIDLIRGLVKEIGVNKIPLPRGKKGVFVAYPGTLDKARAQTELRANGMAIKPGMPVEITKITFKSEEIVFEINGGGKKREKWYQHLEIGMGGATAPVTNSTPDLAFGSFIKLTFAGKVPSLTVPEVKQALGSVLDWERHSPTVLYTPTVPPQFKDAIKNHQVVAGMNRDAVLSSKGPPDRRVRETRNGTEQEDWIYGLPPHVLFVTFDGDIVVSAKQY